MGFQYPPEPTDIRELISRKEAIQAELDAQLSILQANQCTMNTPLVDWEGFPRADIDIYAVRHARVRIIALRNDMSSVMDEIGRALETIYDPARAPQKEESASAQKAEDLKPFARVDGVAPDSPAAAAVCRLTCQNIQSNDMTHRDWNARISSSNLVI
jgi:26S proteasome regulatory subunit N4